MLYPLLFVLPLRGKDDFAILFATNLLPLWGMYYQALCTMHHALCTMLFAPCSLLHALCSLRPRHKCIAFGGISLRSTCLVSLVNPSLHRRHTFFHPQWHRRTFQIMIKELCHTDIEVFLILPFHRPMRLTAVIE